MKYRAALVTGASSGIGRSLAVALGKRGVEVVLTARRAELLEEAAGEVREAGGRAHVRVLDVGNAGAVEAALREVDDAVGGIDLVIANAGMGLQSAAQRLTWERCQGTIDVNVSGAVATLVALLPRMVARKHGHLVGISSLAQYRGLPQNATYCASKAFLSTFLESLRVDLHGTGVAVTDVRPGFVRTPMTSSNRHPMPGLLDAPAAAARIVAAIEDRRPILTFPWALATAVRAASILPPALYDSLIRQTRRPTKP